jgi:NADH dehydrogenase
LTVFVTGASGFVGRRLVARLAASPQYRVRALVRRAPIKPNPAVEWIQGDLLAPDSYERYLAGVDQVMHLGAAVGRCRRAVYFAVNDLATAQLLERCQAAGVARFLYVSTIAARFNNLAVYPYADSKLLAERRVRSSGLAYQIVRPTIVVGNDGPGWQSLAKLASMPVTPVFGTGHTQVQPIDVDDLVECITALGDAPIEETVIELGGPEVTTMSDFLRRIHQIASDRPFRAWRWPLPAVHALAAALESVLDHRAPITRGQLSVFGQDSTAQASTFFDRMRSQLHGIDEMIARAAAPVHNETAAGDEPALRQECRRLHQYMFGSEPAESVWQAYRSAHEQGIIDKSAASDWDWRLVRAARRSPWLCPLLDNYCRFLAPRSLLRRKLVLLLAISEWESDLTHHVQLSRPTGAWWVGIRIVMRLSVAGLYALVSAVALTPLKWLSHQPTSSRPVAGK